MVIPHTSRDFVHVPVSAGYDAGTAPEIAFVTHDDAPADNEWNAAVWVDDNARILIGPGGSVTDLTEGEYHVFVRFTAGAERPVRESGILILT